MGGGETRRSLADDLGISTQTLYFYAKTLAAQYGDLYDPFKSGEYLFRVMKPNDFKEHFKPREKYPPHEEKAYIETMKYLKSIK